MTAFSILDLAPVPDGSTPADAIRRGLELAQHAERWGYRRYWVAEHHNMVGIASAATSVVIGYIAGGTSTIRVGAGGIMLPNHSPLVIAEQFGTLESLYPGRIDLGLGRAPGTDRAAALALRRNLASDENQFPRDVVELMEYFEAPKDGRAVRSIPGEGLDVPVWILGSSLFGAQLAAMLGLPYAFASHFAPGQMNDAIAVYRERFRPSKQLDRPYVMLGFNVFAAETHEEAELLATSVQQAFVNLHTGRASRLPPPAPGFAETLPLQARALLRQVLACSAIGDAATVSREIQSFVERTGADELMITSQIYDHEARLRSYEIVAETVAE
jgi:luciferase family oxidoreductase group 1